MTKSFPIFIYVSSGIFATLLIIVSGINYYFDPANLFGDRTYEAGVARLLSEGKNVANVTNYDERLLQKFFVERLKKPRDLLVLGSSRSMNISSDLFPGMTFYNASVSGASLEDYYAIFQIYRESGLLPKLLILGIDPWIFNRNNEQTRWKSIEQEYRQSLNENAFDTVPSEAVISQWISKLQQLLNFDYFLEALRVARRVERDYYATNETELDVNIRLADGTIAYKRNYAHRNPEKVADEVHQQIVKVPLYSLGRFHELDPVYVQQIEAFIKHLRSEGIEVIVFLPPYHPDMYATISKTGSSYRTVMDVENFIIRLAKKHNLHVWGSYDPNRTLCGWNDFFDEMHPKPTCIAKLIKELQLPMEGTKPIPITSSR